MHFFQVYRVGPWASNAQAERERERETERKKCFFIRVYFWSDCQDRLSRKRRWFILKNGAPYLTSLKENHVRVCSLQPISTVKYHFESMSGASENAKQG